MKRIFGKRMAALLLCVCMATLLLPTAAFAVVDAPTIKAIHFIDGGSSTVYVNEATSSGAGSDSIKYIYSDDIILHSDVLDGLKRLLGPGHTALVPAPAESAGIAASDSGDTPTAAWADAEYVAENVIPGSGTVTGSTNNINASAASMATDLSALEIVLEAENRAAWEAKEAENEAAWETQEAENKAAWEADPDNTGKPYVSTEYVPSEYLPLDFTGTTVDTPPTLETNQFTQRVGMFLSGPFYKYESGVIKESYDINLVCHTVTVLSGTANKAIPFGAVDLSVYTIENDTDTDYVLRPGLTATFAPDADTTYGTLDTTNGDGVKIDYYNPMQNPTGLDSGYSKLVEYNIQIPLTGYAGSTLTGAITLPLPSGHDGATAKIVGGATATSSTGATVTFPVTLAVSNNVATLNFNAEYKAVYAVTVNGSYAATSGTGDYAEGETVTISAGSRSGYSFTGWTVNSGGAVPVSPGSATTTFAMPGNAVTVTAGWSYNVGGGDDSDPETVYNTDKGGGGTWSQGAMAGYSFTFNAPYSRFRSLRMDGAVVATSNYDKTEGSTIITLHADYLKTLSVGAHTLRAIFSDGYAQTTFTIAEADKTNPDTGAWDNPFTDVSESDWFYEDVALCYLLDLMKGTSNTTFSPYDTTTRGMIVTILYRLEGEPAVAVASPFTDVENDKYYANAITWAAENDIVGGYGGGLFGPEDAITREQMAAILYRYAQHKDYDTSVGENTNILSYNDAFDVSDWAIPAMQWACGAGIIEGDAGNLMPTSGAARAQAAAMLIRFLNTIVE